MAVTPESAGTDGGGPSATAVGSHWAGRAGRPAARRLRRRDPPSRHNTAAGRSRAGPASPPRAAPAGQPAARAVRRIPPADGRDHLAALATDLRLVNDPDARLQPTARANLAAWLERDAATFYRGPRPDLAVELDQLIEPARPILGARRANLLRFHTGLPATPAQ